MVSGLARSLGFRGLESLESSESLESLEGLRGSEGLGLWEESLKPYKP